MSEPKKEKLMMKLAELVKGLPDKSQSKIYKDALRLSTKQLSGFIGTVKEGMKNGKF